MLVSFDCPENSAFVKNVLELSGYVERAEEYYRHEEELTDESIGNVYFEMYVGRST